MVAYVDPQPIGKDFAQKHNFFPKKAYSSLNEMLDQEKINKLRIIVKSDVAGTSEAIVASLQKIGNEEVEVDIVSYGVGGITSSDINLANYNRCKSSGF